MTREEAKQFGISLLEGIAERNTGEYAENVRLAIAALTEPLLSSNLDEASYKLGEELIPIEAGEVLSSDGSFYESEDKNWGKRFSFIQGFKAGAKWMAEQGITITGDTDDEYVRILEDVEKAICKIAPDSTVNVQIRK